MSDEQDGNGDGGVTIKQGEKQGGDLGVQTPGLTPDPAPSPAPPAPSPAPGETPSGTPGETPGSATSRAREAHGGKQFEKGGTPWNKGRKMSGTTSASGPAPASATSASTSAPQTPSGGAQAPSPTPVAPSPAVVTPAQPKSEAEVEIDEAAELERPEGAYEMPQFQEGAKLAPPLPRELTLLAKSLKLYIKDKDTKEAVWDYFSNAPPNELNGWSLFNALSAHGVKDSTTNWICRYVFPPNTDRNPYGAPGPVDNNPYPHPGYAQTRATMMDERPEDPVAKMEREAALEDARAKAALSRMERAAYVAKMGAPVPQGDGGVSTPEILQMVQTIMAMKNEGSSPAEILDVALKLTQATRPPDNGGQPSLTAFQLEMQKIQNEERARTHERELSLLQSKADADKAAALAGAQAQNPSNSVDAAMAMLGKFQSAGLAASPASPQIQKEMRELDLRYGLAQMKAEEERQRRADEAAFRRQKEQQDQATGDRLVQLANKAVEVIAEPISRAVGESIKGGARIGGPVGAPAPVPAQPLTREQQIQQLQQLQARAKAAQEELERQGQGQPTA